MPISHLRKRKGAKIGQRLLLLTNRKLLTHFQLVPKPTTFDDLERLSRTLFKNTRISKPTTKIWMKIDHTTYDKNVGLGLRDYIVSGNIRCMHAYIRGGSPERKRHTTMGWSKKAFSVLSVAMSSEPLVIRPALPVLYTLHVHYIAIFSPSAFHWLQNTWPWMTSSSHFTFNSVFAPVRLASRLWISQIQGGPKKPDHFWELITLWGLEVERHVIHQKFANFV